MTPKSALELEGEQPGGLELEAKDHRLTILVADIGFAAPGYGVVTGVGDNGGGCGPTAPRQNPAGRIGHFDTDHPRPERGQVQHQLPAGEQERIGGKTAALGRFEGAQPSPRP